jgi:prephenate dehydrogenase
LRLKERGTLQTTIVGTGLIGGSIALALKAAEPSARVVGYDPDRAVLDEALRRGALTDAVESPERAAAGADVVWLALPVDRIPQMCAAIAPVVASIAVVTDVGSAKSDVVTHGEAAFGDRFVGGHPMAGSERHGIAAAEATLFEGAWWILTPTERTSSSAYSTVATLVARLGAKPVAVAPHTHDALVARLSHLPQLTASALVEVAVAAGDRDALLGLAAGGFRDVTRIAASNPDLWIAILRSNRRAVLGALAGMRGRLEEVAAMIEAGRWEELRTRLERARSARLELFTKPEYGGEPINLSMMVPDRPGLLAEVTTAAGELGANIEDLRIVHSTEGGRGRLELVIAGEGPAAALAAALTRLGYRVERNEVE